jgi:hypothetical protein
MHPHTSASNPRISRLLWLAALLPALTGCGVGPVIPPSARPGVALHGRVHGGQQPVDAAQVYLLAANTTGYAGNGIAPSAANASVSLLNGALTANSDPIGAFVVTDVNGDFDISGDYTCTPGQQVYLYAGGGNPGGGTNTHIGLMAVLGNCPAAGDFSSVPFVEINEVSTIAAAYAMAGYASDATHVSTNGSTQALTGIANAFATASNLVDLGSGLALTSTPAGNGTVPTQTINTLANILAACVNTADVLGFGFLPNFPSPSCFALVENASTLGNTNGGGNAATDTAGAAINIAHYPGNAVATLFALPTATPPFSNALSTQPNDFSLSIVFTGGLVSAGRPAVDAQGDVWIADYNGAVAEFSPLGVSLSSTWIQSNFQSPASVAIDASGNAWLNNTQPGSSLTEYSSAGSEINTSGATGIAYFVPVSPVLDLSGNLWVVNANFTANLVEFSSTGTFTQKLSSNGIGGPHFLAIDTANSIWVANAFTISKFTAGAAAAAAGSPFSLTDSSNPAALAFDASGNLWALKNDLAVDVLNSSGAEIAGSPYNTSANAPSGTLVLGHLLDGAGNDWIASTYTNYLSFPTNTVSTVTELSHTGSRVASFTPKGIGGLALDSAGNLWVTNGSQLLEYIGLSTPIETPLIRALSDDCLAQMPCLPPS